LSALVAALLAGAGGAAAALAFYLFVLAIASVGYRPARRVRPEPANRLIVLVPAHDEERLVQRTVRSLLAQDYPAGLLQVVVIADNCSDATAGLAEAAGARVFVRTDPDQKGKGQALRWALDRLVAAGERFDAAVVVDADSTVRPGFLRALEAELAAGSQVVQADYSLVAEGGGPRTELVAAGFLLFHRVRFGGRARLGMAANLVGNGMLFGRDVLTAHPWSAFTGVEDLEYSMDLRLAGVRPRFAAGARIEGTPAVGANGAMRQRLRWEGGRFNVVKTRFGRLVWAVIRHGRLDLLDAALDLATPPLGLLGMASAAGLAVTFAAALLGWIPAWAVLPWALALALIAGFVVIGLASAGAPRSAWKALAMAPVFLAWKVVAYLRIARGFDPRRWDRTDRAAAPATAGRIEIADVPVDPVGMDEALDRICSAIGRGRLFQVSTINLDFMVRARTDVRIMRIFRRSDLNLADGAPVVALGRLLGARIPGRVAGADVVPALMPRLAELGARVFLLGGENGVAARAAAILSEQFPGLQVAGVYEPARCAVEEMDGEAIGALIAEARADVLLVALGHPKQERFIEAYREMLPVSVAMGVGCVFDLIAGESRRAPAWMQAAGLEWAFRLFQEPGRLLRRYVTDAAWLIPITATVLRERLASGLAGEAA